MPNSKNHSYTRKSRAPVPLVVIFTGSAAHGRDMAISSGTGGCSFVE